MFRLFCLLLFFSFLSCRTNKEENKQSILLIPESGFSFKLHQRDYIEIPSSAGSVICQIDDITMGQTQLTISNEDKILISKSIQPKETLVFEYSERQYQIICEHLENRILGNDYGHFSIQFLTNSIRLDSEIEKIEDLLSKIEKADLIFIRNGKEYSSHDASAHLRTKWKQSPEIVNLNDFIDKIASHSSTTNKPYQVKMKNGVIINAKDWYILSND